MMKHYDVEYISPSGIQGTHTAVDAESVIHAAQLSPVMLSYGTPWKPEEWEVISVIPTPKKNLPMTPEEHEAYMKKYNSLTNRILRLLRLR